MQASSDFAPVGGPCTYSSYTTPGDVAGVRIYGERIDLSELGTPEELAARVEPFPVNADRELAAIARR